MGKVDKLFTIVLFEIQIICKIGTGKVAKNTCVNLKNMESLKI